MTVEKFENEINTLKKFYEIFCIDKHSNQKRYIIKTEYKDTIFNLELHLCEECFEAINYSFSRLQSCPHEIKPRCRKCPNPCYEKQRWKNIAKIMKYSAIKLSLSKIKSKVKNLFN
ncbi:nitrous oxide-stimulated promoter family protein [Aliarcobacter lanthieri]|uniref:nitrous oxide-stimulated promoter family protein n=1 Tax=Aliarcobacter lanthieri TaxID=1355374 RepID=UPI00047D8EF9|nr:nitrous oxide-stimulated promoter family protein [Aliarcobacter lanthieri]QKF60250.1 putative nitrous oxide-regulated protein [Aliarcobacter lanthieri]